jgi:hypothetical protein
MMVYNAQSLGTWPIVCNSGEREGTHFWKMKPFLSTRDWREGPTVLGPLEGTQMSTD